MLSAVACVARYITRPLDCLSRLGPGRVHGWAAAYRQQQGIFVRPDLILDIERRVRKELTLQRLLATARRAASVVMPTVSRTGPKPYHATAAPRMKPGRRRPWSASPAGTATVTDA
jgi:hypothetical protein